MYAGKSKNILIVHSGHQEEKQASLSITEKVFSNIIIVHRAHQERKYHQKGILNIFAPWAPASKACKY